MEDHKKAMEVLVRGHELANQLRQVINGDDKSATVTPLAQHLVNNVISSFTNTLFLLDTCKSHEVSQRDTNSLVKSENSLLSYKNSTCKGRRGCYKTRNTMQTWENVSEIQIDDGFQWRKYGQKSILNAKYSRTYYRCTYKIDQRCQATKHVHRIQEEPPLYKTTYFGHHTCKILLNPEILHHLNSPPRTSIFISFNKTSTPTKQDYPFLSSDSPSPLVKKECTEDVPSLCTLENSSRHVTLSSTLESNHKDVLSGVLYDSIEFEDIFQNLLDLDDQMGMCGL